MRPLTTLFAGVSLLATLVLPAHADEAAVKQKFETSMQAVVDSVTKTPYFGLFEVYAAGQIYYTDEAVSAVIAGNILDPKLRRNVTADRLKKLSAVRIDQLPLDKAVKIVRGKGTRTLVTFEDPNCGYCKRIAKDIDQLKDVTVYTFLYPILSPDSTEKSRKVWCAENRADAWRKLMLEGKEPVAKEGCEAPSQAVIELGRKYSITGTPTFVFANGDRVPGAIGLAEIEKRLDAAPGN